MPTSLLLLFRLPEGVEYGGGLLDLAASQSKGWEADSDGEVTGEIG